MEHPSSVKILVIDDALDRLTHLLDTLRQDFIVLTAGTGREGLRLAQQAKPAVVLAAVAGINIDGFAIARTLGNDPQTVGIKVMLMGSQSVADEEVRGRKAGAVDYVLRAINPGDMRERVHRLFATKPPGDQLSQIRLLRWRCGGAGKLCYATVC